MSTGIVILNYGNYNDTINCIKSVYEYCSGQNVLIVIVDNGSQNDSIVQISTFLAQLNLQHHIIGSDESIVQLDCEVVIIQTNKNLGYARGNNVGIQFLIKLKLEEILILNNDILLTSNIISPLISALDSNPEIGIISPLLMKDENEIDYNCCRISPTTKILICESIKYLKLVGINKIIDQKYLLKLKPELVNQELVYCDIVSGACIMAKRVTWEKLNGFDETTFLYYEENILFEKLKYLNLKMALLTKVNAIHLGARATIKVPNTKILRIELESLLYYLRNFRKTNHFIITLIKFFKLFQINMLSIYSIVKKIKSRN